MATIFTHGIVALTLGITNITGKLKPPVIAAGVVLSMLPDADVISFSAGIPYESVLGHRGFSHSIVFAFLAASMISLLFLLKKQYPAKEIFTTIFLFLFAATISHGILDACTSGGLGVGFFIPFENSRYFFGWRPLLVSPIGAANFINSYGLAVLKSEIKYIWIPCVIFVASLKIVEKFKTHA